MSTPVLTPRPAPAGPSATAGEATAAPALRRAWILNGPWDAVWFLGLPFVAVAVALGFQAWLPFVAVASINLWITVPHHYATWIRSYGMPDVWARFKDRLILGPIVILLFTAVGLLTAPITLLLLVSAWDHQHSIMQQHGLARIYDFKGKTGLPSTGRFDLTLHWILYGTMFINAPMFRFLWIRELHRLQVPISPAFVEALMVASWVVLGAYLLVYTWHLWRTVRSGGAINPIKYAFIGASYFLWYFVAWHTNSILLYAVAHRIMHGIQYIVMVYIFMDNSARKPGAKRGLWTRLVGERRWVLFVLGGIAYAGIFQLLINRPMDEFGFGVVNFAPYPAIEQFNLPALGYHGSFELWSIMVVYIAGMMHYYVDSFIWKVRDKQVQEGL